MRKRGRGPNKNGSRKRTAQPAQHDERDSLRKEYEYLLPEASINSPMSATAVSRGAYRAAKTLSERDSDRTKPLTPAERALLTIRVALGPWDYDATYASVKNMERAKHVSDTFIQNGGKANFDIIMTLNKYFDASVRFVKEFIKVADATKSYAENDALRKRQVTHTRRKQRASY